METMYAIIEVSATGKSWTVTAGKGCHSGFSSFKWAAKFAEGMGYTIWLDSDV